MTLIPDYRAGRREGERRRDEGVDRAARRKHRLILRGQVRLLDAILASPDRTATTDDAVRHLDKSYSDGGKWRGSVPLGLVRGGLIRRAGVVRSARPSRHAGYIALWAAAADDAALDAHRDRLRRLLAELIEPGC